MRVKVLQHHIERGIPGKSMSCAIALAILEQFPEAEVYVRLDRVFIWEKDVAPVCNGAHAWWFTDHNPADFIRSFDAGLPVSPMEFEMEKYQVP